MKKFAILLIFILLVSLCGCAGYREIDRGYLVTALGISRLNGQTNLTIEAVASSDVSDKSSQRQILTAIGNTADAAFEQLKSQLVKPLYFEQLGAVVFEDDVNDKDIKFLKNIENINYGIYLVKTDDINALFNAETPSGVLGYDIIGLIKNYNKENGGKITNQFYHIQRNKNRLPIVNVADGNLIFNVLGD